MIKTILLKFKMFTAFHREKNTKEWEDERKSCTSSKRVTASMLSCVFSCNKSHSRVAYWKHLHLGTPFPSSDFGEMIMRSGQEKEPKALNRLTTIHEYIQNAVIHDDIGTMIYWKDNRLSCTSDAIIVDGGDLVGIEVKCPFSRKSFEESLENPRIDYYLQCMMNMELHCINSWILFVYWNNDEWVMYEFTRDEDTWNEIVYPEITTFLDMKQYSPPPSRDYFSKCREYITQGMEDMTYRKTLSPSLRSHVDPLNDS